MKDIIETVFMVIGFILLMLVQILPLAIAIGLGLVG